MIQTTLDRIKQLCQKHHTPASNAGAHRLAGTVLKIIAEGEKPPLLARFDKCVETLRCYFHAGQDGDAAVQVLEKEIRPAIERLINQIPPEMGDRKIILRKCPVGHTELIGENWVDNGCPWCKLKQFTKL